MGCSGRRSSSWMVSRSGEATGLNNFYPQQVPARLHNFTILEILRGWMSSIS